MPLEVLEVVWKPQKSLALIECMTKILPKLMLDFGLIGSDPPSGGPVWLASEDTEFILDPSGDPSRPGEYTV